MPRDLRNRLIATILASVLLLSASARGFSQVIELESLTDALRLVITARSANTPDTANSELAQQPSARQLVFQQTLVPDPNLLFRLQAIFLAYFDTPIDLIPFLRKLVRESAVAAVPGQGKVLYNPAHMLILHLPDGWENGSEIRVAALEDLRSILRHERPDNPLLAAYGGGFEEFGLLSKLMGDANAREALEVIWMTSPRSEGDKERMRYLLLRAFQQAADIQKETPACRQTMNRFVDDVRAGKRASVPVIQGLTNIVKPTRFIRWENVIVLVLSDALIARYYVIAQLDADAQGCRIVSELPILAR